jgi:hypothetical protein
VAVIMICAPLPGPHVAASTRCGRVWHHHAWSYGSRARRVTQACAPQMFEATDRACSGGMQRKQSSRVSRNITCSKGCNAAGQVLCPAAAPCFGSEHCSTKTRWCLAKTTCCCNSSASMKSAWHGAAPTKKQSECVLLLLLLLLLLPCSSFCRLSAASKLRANAGSVLSR